MFLRQLHRWTSMVFLLIVAAIFAALGMGIQPVNWVYFLPLVPLAILAATGIYLFVLPYITRR